MRATLVEAIHELTVVCGKYALNWHLEFAEGEGLYYAWTDGPAGRADFFEVKKASTLLNAVEYLTQRVKLHDGNALREAVA